MSRHRRMYVRHLYSHGFRLNQEPVVCASLAAGLECCEEPARCMRADQIDISRCPGAVGLVQTIRGTLLCVPVCVMMADGPMDG